MTKTKKDWGVTENIMIKDNEARHVIFFDGH